MKSVTGRVYCSSANIGSGFDSFGICHSAFFSDGNLSITEEQGPLKIDFRSNLNDFDMLENSALAVIRKIAEDFEIISHLSLELNSTIPVGMGLGSSGAASVSSSVLMNELFSLDLPVNEIIKYASYGENFASGSFHLDNVTASTIGNFSAVFSESPLRIRKFDIPENIGFISIVPQIIARNKTQENRKLLPEMIPFKKVVRNINFSNSLLAGIITGDRDLMEYGLDDQIVEQARMIKYDFLVDVRSICKRNNAIGLILSGAGPAMLCFTDDRTDKGQIRKDLTHYFQSRELDFIMADSYPSAGAYERN
ncbi:homoserine kinase [Cuniculiplasma divulgatum]|uniref:Homoserine kinase n=1 Tax=Cuniculiplasma divulgatum TaxID=1673428 RepID=A0A1R4A6E9_9ARCH|nr:homoserine kinase [Cuniculiplasma divulgatum]SJK84557.1 homoserine kinase [Cuniculiplasma divulgatum]